MKLIRITRELFTIVDDEDFDIISQYSWYAHKSDNNTFYARSEIDGKKVYLHRFLLGINKRSIQIDHINGDKLDNRKSNLRITDAKGNGANKKPKKNGSSKYKGVSFRKRCIDNPWEASVESAGKNYYLGNFKTEIEAAKAYDAKAKELFGEFAKLNMN